MDNETRIDLTAEQARAGADARVTIPESRQTVTVKIPPGVRDGMTLRLRGQGTPRPDGTPGDFLIRLRVR
jgi:DnaJ-class molecular chaperone